MPGLIWFFFFPFCFRIKNWLKNCSMCWLTQTITTSTHIGTPRRCSRVHSYVSSTAKSPPSCVHTNSPKAPSASTHLQSPGLESTGSYTHLKEIHTHTHIQQHTHNHTMQISDVSLYLLLFFFLSVISEGEKKLLCSLHVTQWTCFLSLRVGHRSVPCFCLLIWTFARSVLRRPVEEDDGLGGPTTTRKSLNTRLVFIDTIKSVLYRQKKVVACQRKENLFVKLELAVIVLKK